MKKSKKALALFLAVLMMLTMVPQFAFATNTGYGIEIIGTQSAADVSTQFESMLNLVYQVPLAPNEFLLLVKVKSPNTLSTIGFNLEFDASQVELMNPFTTTQNTTGDGSSITAETVAANNGNPIPIEVGMVPTGTTANLATQMFSFFPGSKDNIKRVQIALSTTSPATSNGVYQAVTVIRVKGPELKTDEDGNLLETLADVLDASAIRIVTDADVLATMSQNASADIATGSATYAYEPVEGTLKSESENGTYDGEFTEYSLSYPGSNKAPDQTLENFTLSGTGITGNDGAYTASLSAPEDKDADAATLTIKAAAIGDLGVAMNSFPTDATWSILGADDNVVTPPTGVTFNGTGDTATLTIQPANGLGTSTTYKIKVVSGQVSEIITVTIAKDAPEVTSVKIFNGEKDVTNGTIDMLKSATEQTLTLTGKVYDQYGVEMNPGTQQWSAFTATNGFSFDNATGVITLDSDATVTQTPYVLTFACGAKTATVSVNVKDVTFDWPTATDLIKTGMQYGTKNSDLINALTGYKTSTNVEGTFSVKDGDDVQGAGPQKITVVFTAGTYTFEEEFDVTIEPKEITVTITQTTTDTYGDAFDSDDFTVSSTDLVSPDTIDNTKVTNWQVKAEGATDYVAADGVVFNAGTHDVKVELAATGMENYTIKAVNGTGKYVVEKAPLSATVTDANRVYGAANPTFTATIDENDLVNGDTAADVTITWDLTTIATEESDVDTYAITGTGTADNYTITVTPGTLTVTKAELSLTAKADDVELDSADGWDIDDIADGVGLVNGDTLSDVFGTLEVDPDDPAVYTAAGVVTLTFYDAETYEKITDELETGVQYLVDIAVAANDADLTNYKTTEKAAAAPTEDTADDFTAITFGGDYPIYPVIYYIATFDAGEGTLSGKTNVVVEKGTSVRETPDVIAPEGSTFKGWSINGTDIVDVSTYVITGNVTFVAVYETGETPDKPDEPDVPEIEGYINGYPNGSFAPAQNIKRSEVAKILAVLSKVFNEEATYSGTASDLDLNQWYGVYMSYAIEEGILTGYEDGTVKPTGDIKRGEFAAMLARWLGVEAADGECRFTDMDHWSAPYVEALAEIGIFNGYDNGDGTYSFKPEGYITRAEVVKAINAALKLVADKTADYDKLPTDMAASHWAYWEVLVALNTDVKTLAR